MFGTKQKISIFKSLFTGSRYAYGTYDSSSGKHYQVKQKVNNDVILRHLSGKKPYGFYPLFGNKTRVIVMDFDTRNRLDPMEFLNASKHYGLSPYIERSKSKGYHVWIFFEEDGVLALKPRLVVKLILEEIEKTATEIFPKQDATICSVLYGSFINAPLFGILVPNGKTVFIDPYTFKPYPNQWEFLESVHRHKESHLDYIIELNNLTPVSAVSPAVEHPTIKKHSWFCFPICTQKMLASGVTHYQRVSCFRLAVHLKRLGLPHDAAIAVLKVWAQKNRPQIGKQIISESEIIAQTLYAYAKDYRGYGCNSEAVAPFCEPDCPVARS